MHEQPLELIFTATGCLSPTILSNISEIQRLYRAVFLNR